MRTPCVLRAAVAAATALIFIVVPGCALREVDKQTSHLPVNAADVSFAQGMIVHHREAISFALIEQEGGQSSRARSIADSIEAGHTAELTTLQSLLNTTAR